MYKSNLLHDSSKSKGQEEARDNLYSNEWYFRNNLNQTNNHTWYLSIFLHAHILSHENFTLGKCVNLRQNCQKQYFSGSSGIFLHWAKNFTRTAFAAFVTNIRYEYKTNVSIPWALYTTDSLGFLLYVFGKFKTLVFKNGIENDICTHLAHILSTLCTHLTHTWYLSRTLRTPCV